MNSKEWLSVMQQADDYNPNMTPLIIKYGELLLSESTEPVEGQQTYIIYEDDKVNSLLSVALRNLSNEQLIVLRDSLIERTSPVEGEEGPIEKIFKPYCIDFFSKEPEDIVKQKISFAFDKKDEAFEIFKEMYHTDYGSIDIDDNLISIHTGGWSDNEYLISIFNKTEWWRQNLVLTIRGGHYYFDTEKLSGKKEWEIIKTLPTQ